MRNKHGPKVYIVEDDLELSTVLDRILWSIDPNIQMNWTTSAEEAMHHLKEVRHKADGKPYDLIIADIFLDGPATGVDLWRLSKQYLPKVPLVLTSALSAEKFLASVDCFEICPPFLAKPFSISDCRQILKSTLNGVSHAEN